MICQCDSPFQKSLHGFNRYCATFPRHLGRVRTEKIDGPLSAISGMRLLSGRSKRTLPDLAVLT
jgi:hypothetical protein